MKPMAVNRKTKCRKNEETNAGCSWRKESLPLMREVAARRADGGREKIRLFSPPVFCFAKSSPLVRGGLGCGSSNSVLHRFYATAGSYLRVDALREE